MRFIAYLRVSTDEQTESGAGLAAQTDACRQHAQRCVAELIGPFADEGVGGASALDKRPQLLGALAELSRGHVLLVAKRDRLGRDPIAVAMIEAAVRRKGAAWCPWPGRAPRTTIRRPCSCGGSSTPLVSTNG